MGEIFKPAIALFLVTVIAAACLGFVYNITKEPIKEQKKITKATAMTEISPDSKEFVEINKISEENADVAAKSSQIADIIAKADGFFQEDSPVTSLDLGVDGEAVTSYVVGVAPVGYGGPIEMLVALDTEMKITGVKIITFSETPGLGANAKKAEWIGQFAGKTGKLTVTKGKTPGDSEIDAITSATITSDAVTKGVNTAIAFCESLQ